MGWRYSVSITCDKCGAVGPRRHKGKRPGEDAERAAVKQGWLTALPPCSGCMVHLCPECAAKELPDWWPEEKEIA